MIDRHEKHWGPGWSSYTDGPHRVRYKVERVSGERQVTHVCIEPSPEAKRSEVGLKAERLQAIRPAELLAAHRAFWTAFAAGDEHALALLVPESPKRWTDADLPRVRDVFLAAQAAGDSPSRRLQELGVPESTAHRLIRRARERFPEQMGARTRGPRIRKDDRG